MQLNKAKNFFQSFWGGIIVVIIVIAVVYLIYNSLKNKGVSFIVEGPELAKSGEIIDLHLIYSNNSRVVLQGGEIEIKLPEGILSVEEPSKNIINLYLGEIAPKDSEDKLFKVLITGEPKTSKTIQAVFRYRPKSLSSNFEIPVDYNISIFGSNFSLEMNFPQEIFLDQSFPLELHWENQTKEIFENLEIEALWPEGFNLVESNPGASSAQNNIWKLETITPYGSGKINITGLVSGEAGQTKKIAFILGIKSNQQFLPLAKTEGYIRLAANPLEIITLINGEQNYIASLGETLNVTINYKNNYSTPLRNLVLKTVLNGEALDFSTLKAPKALFTLRTQTLSWDGAKVEDLYNLNPQESGSLSFSIKLLKDWPMVSPAQKNPIIEIKSTLESANIPEGASVSTLPRAVSVNNIKINTVCGLEITSYFRDAASGIANQGKLPLRVDEPTDFTIHFKILNSFNTINKIKIQTSLPPGVEFTGQIGGNYGSNLPQYDKNNRQLIWEVGSVEAGSGYLTRPPELIFQVRVTPQYTQINQPVALIEETTFKAVDAFTLQEFSRVYSPVLSNKLTDTTVYPSQGIVQP
ncbi:MAG TPA: hypothetical protein PL164_01265 [Candidatus Paceibacterota bacterium]|nr:hypothetical protein [Candidatus Paceibacterota bacterium]HPP64882.1 hypothetical protein [Candidatus Paceibacterota bacterium]